MQRSQIQRRLLFSCYSLNKDQLIKVIHVFEPEIKIKSILNIRFLRERTCLQSVSIKILWLTTCSLQVVSSSFAIKLEFTLVSQAEKGEIGFMPEKFDAELSCLKL